MRYPGLVIAGALLLANSALAGAPQPLQPWPLLDKTKSVKGPTYDTHGGKVVFSKAQIALDPKSASAFTDRFTLWEPIFSRPLFADSMGNLFRKTGWRCTQEYERFMTVSVNKNKPVVLEQRKMAAEDFDSWRSQSFGSDNTKAALQGPLKWTYDNLDYRFGFASSVVPQLKEGDNAVTFAMHAQCSAEPNGGKTYQDRKMVIAQGQLTLSVAPGDIKKFLKKNGPKLPGHVLSKGLVSKMKKAFQAKAPGKKVLAARSRGRWEVSYGPRTRVLRRRPFLSRTFDGLVVVRDAQTKTCELVMVAFEQGANRSGNGFTGGLEAHYRPGNPFHCEVK